MDLEQLIKQNTMGIPIDTTYQWCLKKAIGNKYHPVDTFSMSEKIDIQEMILLNEEWGGPGKYLLEAQDAEGKQVSSIKKVPIHIVEPAKFEILTQTAQPPKNEDPGFEFDFENNGGRKTWEDELEDMTYKELKTLNQIKQMKQIQEVRKQLAGEKEDTTQAMILEQKRLIEEQKKEIEQMKSFQQQNQIVEMIRANQEQTNKLIAAMANNANNKQESSFDKFLALLGPDLLKIALAPKASPVKELLESPLTQKFLDKLTEKKQETSPMEKVIPGLIEGIATTYGNVTTKIAEGTIEMQKMQMEQEQSDDFLKKMGAIQGMIKNTLPEFGSILQNIQLIKQGKTPNPPEQKEPINQLPPQNPPDSEPEKKPMTIDEVIESAREALKSESPEEVFKKMCVVYRQEGMELIASDQQIKSLIATLGNEKEKQLMGLITQHFGGKTSE